MWKRLTLKENTENSGQFIPSFNIGVPQTPETKRHRHKKHGSYEHVLNIRGLIWNRFKKQNPQMTNCSHGEPGTPLPQEVLEESA